MDALTTAHAATDKALDAMEIYVRSIYLRSVREIYKSWQKFFEQERKEIDKLQEDYEKAKKSGDKKLAKKAGIALAREKKKETIQSKWFHNAVKQTAENLLHVNEKAVEYLNGRLPETYVTNFNAVGELCENAVTGYSYNIVDENTVRELAMSDTSLLPYKEIDPSKDIAWNVRQMKSEVLQGILQGEDMQTIAKRLSNVIGMNENSAVRNARTMVTAAENKGRQDGFYQAEEDGIILEKYWLSVHGERTREAHAAAGNDYSKSKSIPQSQPFIVGGEKLMFPGDSSMGASGWNLYNCRCSVAAVVKGFKKAQAKMATDENQVEKQPISRKPEEYTDSESIDKRLAELQKEMDASSDFNRWVEIEKEQTQLIERKKVLLQQESKARAQETQRRIYEKDYFATKGMGKGYAVDLDGLDEKSMLDAEKALDAVFEKFPSLKNKFPGITVGDLENGELGVCTSLTGEITLNRKYFSNNGYLVEQYRKSVELGFHPAQTEAYSVIVHELGHATDLFISRKGNIFDPSYWSKKDQFTASKQIKKNVMSKLQLKDADIKEGLSTYATMNDSEFVAEAFAEYVTSPTPRPIAVAVGEEIEKMLGGLL